MNRCVALAKIVLILCMCVVAMSTVAAAPKTIPAAASFYPFLGKWHGVGEMMEPGKPTAKLNLTLSCRKVAAGWAIACDMSAKNKTMMISESDLMGVDPVTGKAHWYAITNMGETHDHVAQWVDPNTVHAQYGWTQDGKQMQEDITFNFKKRSITFRSVVTADGHTAGEFSGALRH